MGKHNIDSSAFSAINLLVSLNATSLYSTSDTKTNANIPLVLFKAGSRAIQTAVDYETHV
jgi:hypothetical protein